MENNIVDFNFKSYDFNKNSYPQLLDIVKHYDDVITSYFKETGDLGKDSSFVIKVRDLNTVSEDEDEDEYFNCITIDSKEGNIVPKNYSSNTTMTEVFPYSSNIRVSGYMDNRFIFTFLYYNQNNCCGAGTVSATSINERLKYNGLGYILQAFKQDIANQNRHSILTCTDVYYQGNIKDTVYRVFFPKDVLDDKMKCDLSFEVYMKCFLIQIIKNFKNLFDECDFFVGDRFCRYEDLNGQIFHIREEIEDDIVKLYYELRLINSTISTDNMKLLNEDEFQTFIKERGI
jgi:hypothetical protein